MKEFFWWALLLGSCALGGALWFYALTKLITG
jgi:hypothetical protein